VIVDLRDARGKWHRHIHVQDLKPVTSDGINKKRRVETKEGDLDGTGIDDLMKQTHEESNDPLEELDRCTLV